MIYHYTTIDTLALILESKKLRFTRLDLLDDLQEFNLFKSFPIQFSHYVSCWTENQTENIPLWKMYTTDMHGIRIGLKNANLKLPNMGDPSSMYYDDYFVCADHIRPYFQKVQYVEDRKLNRILNLIVQKNGKTVEVGKNGYGVGYHKSLYWEFQKESRFILQIFSLKDGFDKGLSRQVQGIEPEEKYFDIPFLDQAFSDLELVLGPKCTHAEELIVKALLKAYGITCDVKRSSLSEIIRQ